MQSAEFNHPQLVEIYDLQNLWGVAEEFFMACANEHPNSRILDLGCGTGRITLALAQVGHTVTGIDPAKASLAVAQQKPCADQVTWINGTSTQAPAQAFDLAFMTSHVAQEIADEEQWQDTLDDLHRALVPGGRLIFDSRDPAAHAWEAWNPKDSYETVVLKNGEQVNIYTEVTQVSGELITFVHHYQFTGSDQSLQSQSTLRFRSEEKLRSTLHAAGFQIKQIYGGWQRETVGQGNGEFIVVAWRQ